MTTTVTNLMMQLPQLPEFPTLAGMMSATAIAVLALLLFAREVFRVPARSRAGDRGGALTVAIVPMLFVFTVVMLTRAILILRAAGG